MSGDPLDPRPGECEDPCPQCGYSQADHDDAQADACAERYGLDSLLVSDAARYSDDANLPPEPREHDEHEPEEVPEGALSSSALPIIGEPEVPKTISVSPPAGTVVYFGGPGKVVSKIVCEGKDIRMVGDVVSIDRERGTVNVRWRLDKP